MKFLLLLAVISAWFLSGFISPVYAASCGTQNQRPCTIFERIPSCNKGLYEDFKRGKCLRPRPSKPKPLACGAANKRPCKVWERIPSCNKGLVENFAKGRCETPKPLACGANKQRPCKVWERIPSCNKGLTENFARGRCEKPKPLACGGQNQTPCKIWERIPSCNNGLVENFVQGRCVRGAHHREFQLANKKLAEIGSVIGHYLDRTIGLSNNLALIQALQSGNQQAVLRALKQRLSNRPIPLPGGEQIRTVSAGIGSNVQIIAGGSGSAGIAIDLTNRLPPYGYSSADYGVSLGIGAGADVDFGFWVCQANKIGGNAWGIEMGVSDIIQLGKVAKGVIKASDAIKPGADIGITLWFGYDNKFQGFTITPGVGAGLGFGGYIRGATVVQDDPSVDCYGR